MSSSVFPSLQGLGWDVGRTPIWDTTVMQAISGKETRIAKQTYPRWQWDLTFDVLRQGTVNLQTYNEFSTLAGFFNARQGMFDTFLYTDGDDNAVTGQGIATGDGGSTVFKLVRVFGGFVEPVMAPNVVSNVYLNGVAQISSSYVVTYWGNANPGYVTFLTPPGAGVAITADFSYYWPCRFTDDKAGFSKFMANLYAGKKLSFLSVKN